MSQHEEDRMLQLEDDLSVEEMLICRARADAMLVSQKARVKRAQQEASRAILTSDLPDESEAMTGWAACELPACVAAGQLQIAA